MDSLKTIEAATKLHIAENMLRQTSIEKAIDILECFNANMESLRFKDIQQKIVLKKGTLHRILAILKKRKLIIQDVSSRQYSLGPKVVDLAWNIFNRQKLRPVASNYLRQLRDITGETVGLHIPLGSQRICIEEVESLHGLRYSLKVGFSAPLYVGAPGKALLAFNSDSELNEIIKGLDFKPYTQKTVSSPKQLLEDLKQIRKKGYSVTIGERTPGVVGIAAPILDPAGSALGAISVVGPTERLKRQRIKEIVPDLLKICNEISKVLSHPAGY